MLSGDRFRCWDDTPEWSIPRSFRKCSAVPRSCAGCHRRGGGDAGAGKRRHPVWLSRDSHSKPTQTMVCCEARPMLRLVEGPGEVRGSLWLFRTLVLRSGNPAPRDDERCAPLGNQHICVRPWNLSPGDWTAVAARLEQLGAWTLSDPCNHNGSAVSDSGLLSVQRRIGSSVSTFLCIAPRYEREADGLKANELYEYFLSLSGVVPPEPIQIAK
jgi:hypothetical protein